MPTDGIHETSAGFGSEVYRRIIDEGAAMPGTTQENKYKWGTLHFRCEAVKRVYDEIVTEAKVNFLFGVRAVDAETDAAGRVTRLVCAGKEGLFAVRAKVFVDATGDADLTHFAGAESEYGDDEGNVQASTLPSVWAGIDWDEANRNGGGTWQHEKYLSKAIKDNVFTVPDMHLPGIFPAGEGGGYGNVGHVYVDGRSDASLTKGFIDARKFLAEYERYYRSYVPGFSKARLVATGALMGIRESRRIMGDYRLTREDYFVRGCTALIDAIGKTMTDTFAQGVITNMHEYGTGDSVARAENYTLHTYDNGVVLTVYDTDGNEEILALVDKACK